VSESNADPPLEPDEPAGPPVPEGATKPSSPAELPNLVEPLVPAEPRVQPADAQVAPAPPPSRTAPVPPDPTVPSARRLIGASFDLLSKSSDEMRRASFYIGAVVFGTAGGYAIAAWALEVAGTHSTIDEIEAALAGSLGGWMALLGLLAIIGILVATVESRAMAVALLGARSSGRSIGVRAALARSRATFWRIVLGAFLVAIPIGFAQGLATVVLTATIPNATELSFGLLALVGALVGAPFAYVLTGIVLGDVDPFEALRRSFSVFGARKGAAVLVALFESVAQLLILLGVSAGLDLALRVFAGLGLSVDSGMAGILLATVMIAIGVFAAGTLVFTVTALSIAPQVVMFVALTHATFGLDHVRPGGDRDPAVRTRGQPRFRRFTRPMLIGFVLAGVGVLGALTVLPS